MAERLTVNLNNKPAYDIVYQHSFTSLKEEISQFDMTEHKICIVTDSNVNALYGQEVLEIMQTVAQKAVLFEFPAGEESKNLDTVRKVYTFLIQEGFDRKDMLIALGGGVVGDLTGFVAATYLRGISFVQVPTTLLSQVDSSIGGKTGVDFDQYKNMVGAFKMPKLVYTNLSTLRDLPERQFASGMGEVLKHGLIKNASYFEWIISNMYEIDEKELDVLEELVYQSNIIKKKVVEKDPTEQGERALLNFGHTIGHAIEKAKNFQLFHGECVALGCIAAAFISWKHELLSMDEYYEIRDMFVPFGLPISVEDINPEEIVKLTLSDKKMDAGNIKFVLLKKIGKAIISLDVTKEDMLAAVNEIFYSEEDHYE